MNDTSNNNTGDSDTANTEPNAENSAQTTSAGETAAATEKSAAPKTAADSSIPVALTRKEQAAVLSGIVNAQLRTNIPEFNAGDTVKVHARIVEGNKERIQIFEGVVIERNGTTGAAATFTVRKISYNVGVERKFLVNSPRIEKIEVVTRGQVRRAKLYYLRGMRGKASRIKTRYDGSLGATAASGEASTSDNAASTRADIEAPSSSDETLQSQASA